MNGPIQPYAGIICEQHGKVDINKQEYGRKMRQSGAPWKCPKCGEISHFDDIRFKELNPQ